MSGSDLTLDYIVLDILAYKFAQLICTLEACGDSDCTLPIIIVEALLECEVYQCFLRHFACIISNTEQCRSASPLSNVLSCQKELVPILRGEGLHHNTSRTWVVQLWDKLVVGYFLPNFKVSSVYLLIHSHNHDFRIVLWGFCFLGHHLNHVMQSWYLGAGQLILNLRNTKPFSVEHDQIRDFIISFVVLSSPVHEHALQCFRWNVLFSCDPFAVANNSRALRIGCSHKCKSVASPAVL